MKKGGRYHQSNGSARTNESFRDRLDEQHHVGVEASPFCELNIDMIANFPLDYMHLVLLGVVRRLLKSWLGLTAEKKKNFARLHRSNVSVMNCRQQKFGKSVPLEFQRKPRSFSFAALFKATELRMFLCYASPAVLLRIFKTAKIYQHFMLLVTAMRILLSPAQPNASVMFARKCLVSFVECAPDIYGSSIHVYNVHNLVHIADDYDRYGSLDRISSFPFESFLYYLKSYVKRPGKELEQVVKRLYEEHNFLPVTRDEQNLKLKRQHVNGPLGKYRDSDDVIQYSELVHKGRVFRLNSTNNVVFWNNKFCKVVNILQVKSKIVLLLRVFKRCKDVFNYPCSSTCIGISFVEKSLASALVNVHISEIEKCWATDWDSRYFYIVKLLHERNCSA